MLLTKLATQTSTGLLFYTMIHIGTGRFITLKIYCSIASYPILKPKLSISESSAPAPFLHWEAGVCKKITLNHTYSLYMLLKFGWARPFLVNPDSCWANVAVFSYIYFAAHLVFHCMFDCHSLLFFLFVCISGAPKLKTNSFPSLGSSSKYPDI